MSHPSAFGPGFSEQPEQQLQVVVHAGPLAGKGFPITGDLLTFGRGADNDITLDDTQVSRNHAHLIRQGNEVILEDLGSTNGTLVNGKPIEGPHVLQPADIISIGSSVFGVRGFSAPHTIGVTQVSPERPAYSPASPAAGATASPRPASRPSEPETLSRVNLLAIGGILALVVIVLLVAAATAYFLTRDRDSSVVEAPTTTITSPVAGSQVQVNQPVTIQATASTPAGVRRIELWISGVKTAEALSPVAQGQPFLTTSFQWTPVSPGTYTLEVKAYNVDDEAGAPSVVTVNAVGEGAGGTETPTPTLTPETPTPTVPGNPSLTTQIDLNVRAGPSIEYDLLGLLPSGTTVEVLGRDETRQWWQVRFTPASNQVGWVSADPAYSRTSNVENVPISQAPPTPTGTPTGTSIPPTATPTATLVPPTDTPTPTPTFTPTNIPTTIEFDVSPRTIQGGECVQITWNVTGVREIYFQGNGVGGSDTITDCPEESETYNLRVIREDGSVYTEDIDVEVINPIISTGNITIGRNETVDLDRGEIPGDDFRWFVEDEIRRFEALEDVQLAPMSDRSSLQSLSLAECAGADFGSYTFIDGSDDAGSSIDDLIDGRTACYRTDRGRLGKLRFPEYSTGSLRVEWLTWE